MKIGKSAIAGTMESSDIMITVEPGAGSVEIDLSSTVDMYYHDTMLGVLYETLKELDVDSIRIRAVDHGALDCTIRARLITAVKRAQKEEKS